MWYDSPTGITNHLGSLDEFHKLLNERRQAGYDRRERLQEYVVLGLFRLDTCGNCMRIWDAEKFAHCLPVCMAWGDFCSLADQYLDRGIRSSPAAVPTSQVYCAYCKTHWNVNNCHDVTTTSSDELIDLASYVGKTFEDVTKVYESRQDAIYYTRTDKAIQNQRHIDLSLAHPNTDKEWEKGLVKNQHGWIRDVADAYVIQEGDSTSFQLRKYYHRACYRTKICREEENNFRKIFIEAGFKLVDMQETPNEYSQSEHDAPWYRVKTEVGYIDVGWRRRVINIDWGPIQHKEGILDLFDKESVTKGNHFIHAWGWTAAKEYLTKIYQKASDNRAKESRCT